MARSYTNQYIPQRGKKTGLGTPTTIRLPNFIPDNNVNENFQTLEEQLNKLLSLLSKVVDLNTGSIIGIIDPATKKASSGGLKEIPDTSQVVENVGGEGIPAGALATKNSVDLATSEVTNKVASNITNAFDKSADDLDNVNDGTSFKRIESGSVDGSNKIVKIRKTGSDVSADNVLDTVNNDSDDVTEGTTKKFVGSGGTGDLDDVDDGTTYKRVTGVGADHLTTFNSYGNQSVKSVAVENLTLQPEDYDQDSIVITKPADNSIAGRHSTEEVINEFQTMGSTLSDAQWDALEP